MRDVALTMSDEQSLAIDVDADTIGGQANEASDENVPSTPDVVGGTIPETSGEVPAQGLVWHLIAREDTAVAIQVEGQLHAELQFSADQGANWDADHVVHVLIADTPATPDPCLAASGIAHHRINVGHLLEQLGITDPLQARFQTVYTVSGREAGDAVAVVAVTSYLSNN